MTGIDLLSAAIHLLLGAAWRILRVFVPSNAKLYARKLALDEFNHLDLNQHTSGNFDRVAPNTLQDILIFLQLAAHSASFVQLRPAATEANLAKNVSAR